MYYVIGSGPAGVACARGLLDQGLEVTLIDAGLELEESRRQALLRLQEISPTQWRGERAQFLHDGMSAGRAGIPLKMAYGSDFAYRPATGTAKVVLHGASLSASYALGGFSNVWGAAVLPYRQHDLAGWPFPAERLVEHYRAVFEFMPLAGRRDALEEQFPLFAGKFEPLEMSRQARAMLRDLEAHSEALRTRGIRFGSSRLAVAAHRNGNDCALCGLCMYGCPYELIYSSSTTLTQMRQHPRFHYLGGWRVTRVSEMDGRVRILARPVRGGSESGFEGERVYLACGVLSTAALLLRSLEQYDRPILAQDSAYFLLPILRLRGEKGVRSEPLHTLAQLFLEVDDPAISPHTIHLQAYTYNALFEDALRSTFGPLTPVLAREALVSRLLLLQGYLHSAHSPRIRMELRRKGAGRSGAGEDELHVSAEAESKEGESKRIIRALIRKLALCWNRTGAAPLAPLLRRGLPGRGFHTGGVFPMRGDPQGMETDIFGRPAGLTRVHAVDASIFPSVPATTITLTAMANAHRIAAELEQYA